MDSYALGKTFKGRVETLAYGGKGIIRHSNGMVVFVPYTAPGDYIEFCITKLKKNYAEGSLTQILEPSKVRSTPVCPYFGVCGGCQLQHLSYSAQVEYKKKAVQDALSKVYPESLASIHGANPTYAYRRHITLTLKRQKNGYALGYYAEDNKTLIEVKECAIFTRRQDPIIRMTAAFASELSPASVDGKVKIVKLPSGKYLLNFHFKEAPKNFEAIALKHLQEPASLIMGILKKSLNSTWTSGIQEFSFFIEDKEFTTHPTSFLQNHPEVSISIYRALRDHLSKSFCRHLIDLYCGIGISSIMAAPYAKKIDAVELNKKGIELARLNAKNANISNISFIQGSVEKNLGRLLQEEPDTAILNPPREGLSQDVAEALSKSALKKILYVSCQPATLSRDLKIFSKQGFHLEKAEAFDMFPETGHVETLCCLIRNSSSLSLRKVSS